MKTMTLFQHSIAAFKLQAAWKLLIVLGAMFRPIQEELYVIIGLVIADFITGVWKSIRVKSKFSSRKMGNTVGKFGVYFIVLLGAFGFDKWILETGPWLSKGISGFIACVELVSIAENAEQITGLKLKQFIQNFLKRNQNDATK